MGIITFINICTRPESDQHITNYSVIFPGICTGHNYYWTGIPSCHYNRWLAGVSLGGSWKRHNLPYYQLGSGLRAWRGLLIIMDSPDQESDSCVVTLSMSVKSGVEGGLRLVLNWSGASLAVSLVLLWFEILVVHQRIKRSDLRRSFTLSLFQVALLQVA